MSERTTRGKGGRRGGQEDAFAPASSLLVHDIKNLSFRLGALLQNLEKNYEDPLFKRSVVDVLSDTVERMNRLVSRCRDTREGVIIKYRVDLNEILSGIVEAIARNGGNGEGILIEERYTRIPKVWGDPDFLGEAFAIVIQNGLEAMNENGGKLVLSTESAVARTGKRKVVVRIRDTGCGMTPEFLRNCLFSPFVTTKLEGLGMGLYACRKILDIHDAAIRVSSRAGRGTTFRIAFDAA